MAEASAKSRPRREQRSVRLVLILVVASLAAIAIVSPYAFLVVVLDGMAAATIVGPGALAGLWLVPLLRLGQLPLRWHLLLGFAMGIGMTSLAVLILGSLGFLDRGLWIVLLIVAAGLGVARLALLLNAAYIRAKVIAPQRAIEPRLGLIPWILACPFLVMGLLAATTPAGLVWSEEGLGYDVLEYHLEIPKEYFANGQISYLPHNVYANFPSNVEMLYLLAMVVYQDVREASTIANMIHASLAILTVFAGWVAGRQWSPQAGAIAAVAAGATGWLVYLSGLAYVENGLLFFGMTAAACIFRGYAPRRSRPQLPAGENSADESPPSSTTETSPSFATTAMKGGHDLRWVFLAGATSGLSCGCKYTGFVLIALPFCIAIAFLPCFGFRRRLVHSLFFLAVTGLAASPWLVKNLLATGNPVFPLANTIFRGTPQHWTEAETSHWDHAHRPRDDEAGLGAGASALLRHTVGDEYQRFNLPVMLLGIAGLIGRRRDRVDAALATILVAQVLIWSAATHLFARFLVPMLIPTGLLAARSFTAESHALRRRIALSVLLLGAGWSAAFSCKLLAREWPGTIPASLIYEGGVAAYEELGWVKELPPDARIMLVGEARAFYFPPFTAYWTTFNRNPFLENVAAGAVTERHKLLQWLQDRGYTHLLINWSEVRRLARTYGFAPNVSEEEIRRAVAELEMAGLRRIEPREPTAQSASALYSIPSPSTDTRPHHDKDIVAP